MKTRYLSHNHYAISDRTAGQIARTSPGNAGRLPRIGYQRTVQTPDGPATLARTTLTLSDTVKNKRGWVWTIMPELNS